MDKGRRISNRQILSIIRLVAMAFRLGRKYRGFESLMMDHLRISIITANESRCQRED